MGLDLAGSLGLHGNWCFLLIGINAEAVSNHSLPRAILTFIHHQQSLAGFLRVNHPTGFSVMFY